MTEARELLDLMMQAFDPLHPAACHQDCFDYSDGHGYEMQEIAKDEARAYLAQPMTILFQRGTFRLHSGKQSNWKIDCDALTDLDITALAEMIAEGLQFGSVEGVSTGGLRLAKALEVHVSEGPLLIVDDVLTTGASIEKQRAGREAIGAVIFARGAWPVWVMPLFAMCLSYERVN